MEESYLDLRRTNEDTVYSMYQYTLFEDVPEFVQNLREVMNEWDMEADELNIDAASTESQHAFPQRI